MMYSHGHHPCPVKKRRIKKFDAEDKSRFLFAIDTVDWTLSRSDPRAKVVRPREIFGWLHANRIEDWFVTTTFLFPEIDWKKSKSGWNGRYLHQEVMILSIGSSEEASLILMGRSDVWPFPKEWWRLFEDETFKPHPLYPEYETSASGLLKLDGRVIDAEAHTSLDLGRHINGWISRRTIRQLADDIWSTPHKLPRWPVFN